MNTPRKPKQTAKLTKVSSLQGQRTLVKHVGKKSASYWIMYPSINGTECPMVFLQKMPTPMLAIDEARIIRLAEIAISPATRSSVDGLDVSILMLS
jgi:hypothetical protein